MDFEREDIREYRGPPLWYEQDVAPEEEILQESPGAKQRRRARSFSRRYGWIRDLAAALWYYVLSWFTTDIVLGCFRAGYGLIVAALLSAIFYYFYLAADRPSPRVLPTVDELMRPAYHDDHEGPLNPMDGRP